ncbi:MAG: 8-amino-7-oxononanoate synthase [Muribaculaceae bacterium]|nr:8-amino-7-oxononanoate synthase [Muribaculaceae bacterium]
MNGYNEILKIFGDESRLRSIPPHRGEDSLIDLTSNDYMGLAARANQWKKDFFNLFGSQGMTSSASRLLATDQDIYYQLENYLESTYSRPVLLFNSGYHANVGILPALSIPGTLIITDRLIHASAIDGVRLGKGNFTRFNHNDISHLERIIEKEYSGYDRIIIVCESIYSMDGDLGSLSRIADLKRRFPKIILYVDEAHAIGVTGPKGAGVTAKEHLLPEVDIIVGTFGKAVASQGAFAVMREELKSYLINTARSFIFSTMIPPINAAWTLFMLKKLADMEEERNHLSCIASKFREGVKEITGMPNTSRSAIVPLPAGNAENALKLSYLLELEGILALPIRRPTVPPGGERIRFSLHASLSDENVEKILEIVSRVYNKVVV